MMKHPGSVIHIRPMGNLGNRMLQYMAALKLSSLVPYSLISNVRLGEWGIEKPELIQNDVNSESFLSGRLMKLDLDGVSERLRSGGIRRFEIGSYAQDLENFYGPDYYKSVFVSPQSFPGYGEDYLVCNIRGGDILSASTSFYTLLPPEFYLEVIQSTGLKAVFMGQISDNEYSDRLRKMFPNAIFQESLGPIGDFETIRRSTNIVVSVSTFSWLAAWLSDAQQIFLPLSGFYNSPHFEEINLLPLEDKRYRYFLFPHHVAVPMDRLKESHEALVGLWREVSPEMVLKLRREFPRFPIVKSDMLDAFNESFYLSRYSDVRNAVEGKKTFSDGFSHYSRHGFSEKREPFWLDEFWYQVQYPVASIEVGQGDFANFHHHFVAIGKTRGYSVKP